MKTIKLSNTEVERLIKTISNRIEWHGQFDPNFRLMYVQRDPELVKKLKEEKLWRDAIVEQYKGILAKLQG